MFTKFICRCSHEFKSFPAFKSHVVDVHHCGDISIKNIQSDWKRKDRIIEFKFFWKFICQNSSCRKKAFTSSAVTAMVEIKNKSLLEVKKKYSLSCKQCRNEASFAEPKLLDKYLKEIAYQKLIFAAYKDKFPQIEAKEKILEDHIQELCSRCQELGRSCVKEKIEQYVENIYPPYSS